jgi:pyruvate dehydrogenase complex dehydrogenase (E1) component
MEEGQVDEDLASRFIDYLEDQEMDDATSASSIQAFAGWGDRDEDEDNGMNVAGPSRQPF